MHAGSTRIHPAAHRIAPSSLLTLGDCLFRYEEEHRTFIERSPDLIARFDRELRFVYVNPAMIEATGHPVSYYLGRRPSELEPPDPQLRPWEERLARAARQEKEGATPFAWSARSEHGERVFEARLIPERQKDGTVGTVLAVSRDVTARRAAEAEARRTQQYYRALIADSSDLHVVLDAEGIVRFCSDSVTRLLGMSPEQVVGHNVLALIHPDDVAHVAAAQAPGSSAAGESRRVDARIRHAGGGWRRFEIMGKTVELDTGAHTMILNARDVTERHRLESLMHRAQRVAALGRMAGGIAHEFNNLLSTILGTCELLAQDLPDHPQLTAGVGVIREAGRSAASLTQQLLVFGRQQPVRPEPVDLAEAFEAMRPFLIRILGAGVTLEISTTPGDTIVADRGLIEQLILNLAGSAQGGMPHGGRLIIASETFAESHGTRPAGRETPGEQCVRISLRNTGAGMDPDARSHLFDPFASANSSGDDSSLPLALVHSILDQCGGVLEVHTSEDQGEEIRIYLPAGVPAPTPHPTAVPAPTRATAAGWKPNRGWETILVVEDDLAVRQVTKRLLERLGYRVLAASTPGEALVLVRTDHAEIHLVLSDVNLPQMSGPESYERLKAERPGLQVLFVSGYVGEPGANRDVLPAGAQFLQKPYTITQMGDRLRTMLDPNPEIAAVSS